MAGSSLQLGIFALRETEGFARLPSLPIIVQARYVSEKAE